MVAISKVTQWRAKPSRAEIQYLLPVIQARYDLQSLFHTAPLTGGEWKTLWRLDGAQSAYVVSISHPTASQASIVYEHQLLRYLQTHLPQVPAPLLARDGSSYFVDQGRIVSLFPLMFGEMVDGEEVRLPAARFLAAFHRVGLTYPERSARPGVPAWRKWDWCAAAWPLIEAALASAPATSNIGGQRFWQGAGAWATQIVARQEQIREERAHFQWWIADLGNSAYPLTVGLVHDDYHGNNLLTVGDQITALLDWDGCHPDWLLFDLSNALWEFCLDDEAHTLDVTAAQAFLQAYIDAGGPIPAPEFALIIPFIRCRRLIEILGSLQGMVTDGPWDESPDYLVHNLLALENLRTVQLVG